MRFKTGLKTIAVFEAAKGALVLLAGIGLFAWLHHDAQHTVERLVHHLHMNPARHYPQVFLHFVDQATPPHLLWLAIGAFCYSMVRFVEAFGLWHERIWAEWFAILSGGFYLPLEAWEVGKEITWPRVTVLIVNLAIVAWLAWNLAQCQQTSQPSHPTLRTSGENLE